MLMIAIGLIVLVFVLIFKSLGGGPSKPPLNLNSYANSAATAQLTIDGPINADQDHQEVQITVGNAYNQFQILTGYQGTVATTKTFESNQAAYAEFLHALTIAGFTKGNTEASLSDDRGYCPTGERYIFELTQGSDTIIHFWSSSCGGGTYGGNTDTTLNLFENQIPNYYQLTNNLFAI